MKKRVLVISLCIFVLTGVIIYFKEGKEIMNINQNNTQLKSLPYFSKTTKTLRKEDFDFLKKGQDIYYILERIGEPYENQGFGSNIIVYKFENGEIKLFFGINRKLDRYIIKDFED